MTIQRKRFQDLKTIHKNEKVCSSATQKNQREDNYNSLIFYFYYFLLVNDLRKAINLAKV